MNWLLDIRAMTGAHPGQIGPGRLLLVVGPSGAGKDTLVQGARESCADDSSVVFPKRVVTRPSSVAEDHDTMTDVEFSAAVAGGAFALWWGAHGNQYGIPASIDADIRAGKTVVCNVSRTIVVPARRKYTHAAGVLVTAPADVLAARLAGRNRSSDGAAEARIARSATVDQTFEPDFVIQNTGRAAVGVRRLLNAIYDSGFYIVS
jgi:ribose 1,5-bisphosphokinase